jgi:polyhydroxyalkanoate synthesis regulator protein
MQMVVPRYLETSIDSLTREQQKFRDQMTQAFGGVGAFGPLDEHVRRNMEMFTKAFSMFTPFARRDEQATQGETPATTTPPAASNELDDLKRQMAEMAKKIEKLSDGNKS